MPTSKNLEGSEGEEQREMKKRLRALRQDGNDPEGVRTLAHTFHRLVQRHSKLTQEAKREERKRSRQSERKACH